MDSCRGAPNLARLVSVFSRAFQSLMLDSARRRLLISKIENPDLQVIRSASMSFVFSNVKILSPTVNLGLRWEVFKFKSRIMMIAVRISAEGLLVR